MRRLLFGLLFTGVAALALALPANVLAATKTVNIYGAVFQPATVTIQRGDAVRWVNRDNANHQIVADDGTFASPILRQGRSYTHTFRAVGTFRYRDVLGQVKRGTVIVQGAAPAASLTLGVAAPILVFGSQTTLTGTVSNGQAGETVAISAQPYGQATAQQVATVTTGTGGGFAYTVQPDRQTTYVASWKTARSLTVMVQVRPKLTFVPLEGRMYAKVMSPVSHAGGFIYLQRLTPVGWITVSKLTLGPLSGKIFALPRRCGMNTYHVYISADQAGAGWLDGWSGTQKTRYRKHCRRA
jgi:plastocyanin